MVNRLKSELKELLHSGTVMPAYPLALNPDRSFDEFNQRVLTHYYIDAGVGGLAVGVHTTQFEIRDPEHNLFETVLRIAAEEIDKAKLDRPFIKLAGICGPVEQAINEAELAVKYGYDMGLLSMGSLPDYTEEDLLERTKEVAKIIPVFGFYLQPSVGGRIFSYDFWKKFMEIDNVVAVKTAPFNRYQTLDVLRAVCHSSRIDEIAVYTGNDDNIVADLLTPYEMNVDGKFVQKEFLGGLLGHWAVWTKNAVELMDEVKKAKKTGLGYRELLMKGTQVTDANAAFFDINNDFQGCIPGINEMLARQGLLQGNYCLNPNEIMGPGQAEELTRVSRDYPDLSDDDFIRENLELWRERVKG
ncbi:dihydrodipicolinate synthase family protein [Vagococcus fluvialis]|uniref:Dihydrodipicolinate synthase family protein n=1 Tax=Vagococcus fluvialis TaxID=2738 RepID=A0A7X6DA63_9ENTE|nr:dihydrodipicolinate synthase family protein [Vagococcus fluvialis]MDT2746700.1 hypothetical protein [Vagococcus fluvialis]NKC68639.1 dihydrodipicolinate synthase family protein [Vagococcus fluvialis]UDM73515.1 hypothetical protein K5K99_11375 [Vagococcus fluvialis]